MGPWVVQGKTASQSRTAGDTYGSVGCTRKNRISVGTAGDKPGDHSTVTALMGPWVVEG